MSLPPQTEQRRDLPPRLAPLENPLEWVSRYEEILVYNLQGYVLNSKQDLSLPRTMISRLSKGVLPPNTQIQKDALSALSKSATVFVNYIASKYVYFRIFLLCDRFVDDHVCYIGGFKFFN